MAPKEAAALSPAVAAAPAPSAAASAAYAAAADAPLSAAQLSPNFVEYPSSGMMGMLGGGQRRGNSPEVKRATIVGNPMFSAMEGAADLNDDFRPKEDLLGLDDFNLTMDYDQLVEYFDNLKESNA
ncbi:Uncharacterized protein GBIM_09317 [Gryllus bimaculatus]|nr:Uncharacterized protein GBIM_09317 [Gryllus bimaculatus]